MHSGYWMSDYHNSHARNDMNTPNKNRKSHWWNLARKILFVFVLCYHCPCLSNCHCVCHRYCHLHTVQNNRIAYHHHIRNAPCHTRMRFLTYSSHMRHIHCPRNNMVSEMLTRYKTVQILPSIQCVYVSCFLLPFGFLNQQKTTKYLVARRLRTILRIVSCICIFHEPS